MAKIFWLVAMFMQWRVNCFPAGMYEHCGAWEWRTSWSYHQQRIDEPFLRLVQWFRLEVLLSCLTKGLKYNCFSTVEYKWSRCWGFWAFLTAGRRGWGSCNPHQPWHTTLLDAELESYGQCRLSNGLFLPWLHSICRHRSVTHDLQVEHISI